MSSAGNVFNETNFVIKLNILKILLQLSYKGNSVIIRIPLQTCFNMVIEQETMNACTFSV